MDAVVISSTGYFVPPDTISNEELVEAYNAFVDEHNNNYSSDIDHRAIKKLRQSSSDFILKASGIKSRHVINKEGILDRKIMHPLLTERNEHERSLQCEMALSAAKIALKNANKKEHEPDVVIVACSNMQRAYPAISVELQGALGAKGFAYDLNMACSSATFGINLARSLLLSNSAKCVLAVNPEIYTAHLNFRDRRSHFIFGDGCSAAIIEKESTCTSGHPFRIISGKMQTQFSNNIRNDFGFLSRCEQNLQFTDNKLFKQNGKQVREEVVPLTSQHILEHLSEESIQPDKIKRLWLHQANINMNQLIAHQVLGRSAMEHELPMVLDQYGNTGASGVLIAFNKYHNDLYGGDLGVLCSFGAGYSVGSLILKKI